MGPWKDANFEEEKGKHLSKFYNMYIYRLYSCKYLGSLEVQRCKKYIWRYMWENYYFISTGTQECLLYNGNFIKNNFESNLKKN